MAESLQSEEKPNSIARVVLVLYSRIQIDHEAGYSLDANYQCSSWPIIATSNEVIFPINFDGFRTQTWGGTTFHHPQPLWLATCSPLITVLTADGQVHVPTSAFVNKFPVDVFRQQRRQKSHVLHRRDSSLDIEVRGQLPGRMGHHKVHTSHRDGSTGSNATFVDTDFPLFRLGDAYLMYAEAVLRGWRRRHGQSP